MKSDAQGKSVIVSLKAYDKSKGVITLMKKVVKKVVASALTVSVAATMLTTGAMTASAESSTGVGLAAHALTAYREGWQYVWGGTSYGTVDCSGLIYTYNYVGGNRVDMLGSSSEWGYVSNGVPRIHGLGLHTPGHVGVYIGSGMAVDARNEYWGVVYHNVYNASWVEWFKVAGVSYPENGWVLLDGDSFYYENGQYVVSTSRTIDGVTYSFDSAGVSNIAPPSSAYQATDYSVASAAQAEVTSGYSYNDDDGEGVDDESSVEEEESEEEESSEEESSEEEESIEEESSEEESEEEESEEESSEEESEEEESSEEESSEEESSEEESSEEESSEEESSEEESSEEESSEEESSEEESSEEESSEEESSEESVEESSEASVEESSETSVEESSQEPVKEIRIVAEYGDQDYGDSNYVAKTQKRLFELGYTTEKPTGYFDEQTIYDVMCFQSMNNLEETGRVDEETFKLLQSDKAVSTFVDLYFGDYDAAESGKIAALQNRLTELEYYCGDVTGYYGEITAKAVEQFCIDNGIEVTSNADVALQKRIFKIDAKHNPNAGCVVYGMDTEESGRMIRRLAQLRYLAVVKGNVFDDEILEAVYKFQLTAGFDKNEKMTKEMLELLYSEDAPRSPEFDNLKIGYSGDDVAELQNKLALLKYYDGKCSGVFTSELAEAVKKFQKENGLEQTGIADAKTLAMIKIASNRKTIAKTEDKRILQTAKAASDAISNITKSQVTKPAAAATAEKTSTTVSGSDVPASTQDQLPIIGFAGAFLALSAALIALIAKKKKSTDDILR